MKDYLIRALAFDGQVRAYTTTTTNLVQEACKRHDTWPTASAALGRSLTATLMMSSMLKGEQKITVKIEGGGPIGPIVVDANAKGEVRGYVTNPHVNFELNSKGKLDVARAVGTDGFLSVVKDVGMREHFTGQVPLISGELGEDFTYYYVSSEQTPSSVGVGVLVNPDYSIKAAGGFTIQIMPGCEDSTIDAIEKRLSEIPPVSTLIDSGLTPEEILYTLFGEENCKILDKIDVEFKCTCNKKRIEAALISLGEKEIREIIEEEGSAEAHCHFCNETYQFTKDELENLAEQA